jgi:putative phosphoribosyl transferase
VAVEVASRLDAPVDVFVARKIGAPGQPELGLGAIAEGGEPVLDAAMLRSLGLTVDDLATVVRREREELARRVAAYRGRRSLPPLSGADVVLVDDGLATGGTARAALRALRAAGVRRVVIAVPVAPAEAVAALEAEADAVITVAVPRRFRAVGQWYVNFPQVSDREVVELLESAHLTRRS